MSDEKIFSPPVRAAIWLIGLSLLAFSVWHASNVLLVIFAGLLLAAIFHFSAKFIAAKSNFGIKAALVIQYAVLFVILGGILLGGGVAIVTQFSDMVSAINSQIAELNADLRDLGYSVEIGADLLPGSGLNSIRSAASYLVSGFGNLFVILFIAAFISWSPGIYRGGVVSLFPKANRERVAETFDAAAENMAHWALGQAISMVVVFIASWILLSLIGMPYAFALALQAGLLAFIPTIGPLLAGIPMVLAGASVSGMMALYAFGVYVIVQLVESNLLAPIVQRVTTRLAPALTLSTQLVFGALFGLGGMMMAVPILAAATVFVERLYIEDQLGGAVEH